MNRNVYGYIVIVSLLSIIALTGAILVWAFTNDVVLLELHNQTTQLEDKELITNTSRLQLEDMSEDYANLSFYFDYWWLGSYLIFFLSTILVSYHSKEEDYFGFLGTLFFGTMIFLFLISIITTFTDWWVADILYKTIPTLEGNMPMMNHYLENIGMYSFIQILICISANMFYLKIDEFISKNKPGNIRQDEVL